MNTADAVKKQLMTNEKMSYNSYERIVTSYTTCVMETVTNTLHWAVKHIQNETFLESRGDANASVTTTKLLEPVKKKLTNILERL